MSKKDNIAELTKTVATLNKEFHSLEQRLYETEKELDTAQAKLEKALRAKAPRVSFPLRVTANAYLDHDDLYERLQKLNFSDRQLDLLLDALEDASVAMPIAVAVEIDADFNIQVQRK